MLEENISQSQNQRWVETFESLIIEEYYMQRKIGFDINNLWNINPNNTEK